MSAKKIVMMVVAVFIVAVALLLLFNSRLEEPPIKTKTLVENSTGNKESTEINYQEQTLIPIKHKYITEYQLPSKSGPNSMLVDDHGIVWTVGSYSHKLYMLDPNTNKMQSYQIPGEDDTRDRMSWSMLKDNEGFIWFGQFGSDKLWRFDPDHEKFVDFHTMTSSPFQMKLDSKTDEIWFTTLSNDKLGVVQKIENDVNSDNGYRINEFSIGNGSYPSGLTVQGDSIWVTELEKGKIAKFTSIRNYDGEITGIKKTVEIPITNEPFFSFPTDILFTDNNTSWITEHGPSTITQYTMSTHDVTRIPTAQNKYHVSSLPFWMRESHDGNGIWFNEHEGGSIAFLDTHNMTLTEFELPTNSPVIMLNLALDPQNSHKAWFSEWDLDKIGVVEIGVPVPFE
ncbi:MAG: virginiamycin B lyase family protein, partial [Nitrosotalea sp.]